MIFVTVGTHEQQFNRLVKEVDELVKDRIITEKVIMQTGFSTYKPKYCEYKSMLSFSEMKKYIGKAHIVITHGGPSSFIEVLQNGKIPIVVPRQKKYGEHINNHQTEFVKLIQEKKGNIIPIYDIKDLRTAILNYDKSVGKNERLVNHNKQFNLKLDKIVNELLNHE